ncbi:MAG: glycosyltransferase [Nanoarchaeota archaeon]|nr:glycosyltransferase [Nanoarchaeota archaeon]
MVEIKDFFWKSENLLFGLNREMEHIGNKPKLLVKKKVQEDVPKFPKKLPGSFWGITTFFNSEKYKTKLENYKKFRESSKKQGLKLLCVELVFDKDKFSLNKGDADILIQIRGTRKKNLLWQKERLLNIALEKLPSDCDKIAWLDCDIIFQDNKWVDKTSKLLESFNIIQPYSWAVRFPFGNKLEKDFDSLRYGVSEGERLYCLSYGLVFHGKEVLHEEYKYHGHTGLAWAARKSIFDKCRFYDKIPLAFGDKFMAHSFYGNKNFTGREKHSDFLKKDQDKWTDKISSEIKESIYFSRGIIFHLWHGNHVNRRYGEIDNILNKYNFNPNKDLKIGKNKLLEWSSKKIDFQKEISEYFKERKEDLSENEVQFKKLIKELDNPVRDLDGLRFLVDRFMGLSGIFLKKLSKKSYSKLKLKMNFFERYKKYVHLFNRNKDDVSVIMFVKNRGDFRIFNALKSIRLQDYPQKLIKIIIVDYGSDSKHIPYYKKACERFNVEYIRVENDGEWNKSHALNIAIRKVNTKYILSTDVDIIFEKNYFKNVISELKRDFFQVVLCKPFDCPEGQINSEVDVVEKYEEFKKECTYRTKGEPSYHHGTGINFALTFFYKLMRGYDEEYVGWGVMDDDVVKRFNLMGMKTNFITEKTSYLHQWHPYHEEKTVSEEQLEKERNIKKEYFDKNNSVLRNPEGWGEL